MTPRESVITRDGRRLTFLTLGAPDALPVVVHHGTPGSGHPEATWIEGTAARGLRLVTYDRPGYGSSVRHPGRTVADAASDVAAILDAIGAPVCLTAGRSGGGPHTLATAYLLPERVLAAAAIASPAPYGGDGSLTGLPHDAFLAGMGADNVEEFELALAGEAALRPFLDAERPALRSGERETMLAALDGLLPDVDRAELTGRFAQDVLDSFAEGLDPGVDGWLDDDVAFVTPWGFELREPPVPIALWQGGADLMVPASHGAWIADAVPGISAHQLPDDGHLSITTERVLSDLVALAGL